MSMLEPPVIRVLTLFPDVVRMVLATSILGRANRAGRVRYQVVDIREFAADHHGTVDDAAYGGGAGMIMMVGPVVEAVEWCRRRERAPVVLASPQGDRLDESLVQELRDQLLQAGELILICGHYKGVDERIRELVVKREISIGDYVLSGGELPSLVIADAVVRRLPGVLNAAESAASDSFTRHREGGLDCPWYTRPTEYRGLRVPEVLLSGHHDKIERWRHAAARERTRRRRPDLLPESPERGDDASPTNPRAPRGDAET